MKFGFFYYAILFVFVFSANSYADLALIGKWKGVYYGCGQGVPTNAEIDVYENLNAVFRFYASGSRLGEFDGIFHGNIQRNENSVVFVPMSRNISAWFVEPSGSWVTLGFETTLNETNLSMSGNITGDNTGCSSIELTKVTTSGTVSQSLDIHVPSLTYELPTGILNIWADFEFYEKGQNGELLWKLKNYGEN